MKSFLIHSTLIINRAHIAKTTAQAGCKHCCLTVIDSEHIDNGESSCCCHDSKLFSVSTQLLLCFIKLHNNA